MEEDGAGDWTPPTEAELKIIQAKRERSDKISTIMASYLLKGHRMLGSVCPVCETVLLQDKQQKIYCVACTEVDNEHAKDNPVLSGEAARRQIAESQFSDNIVSSDMAKTDIPEASNVSSSNELMGNSTETQSRQSDISHSCTRDEAKGSVPEAIRAVQEKMVWATKNLMQNACVEGSLRWCNLLKACAETLIVLNRVQCENID